MWFTSLVPNRFFTLPTPLQRKRCTSSLRVYLAFTVLGSDFFTFRPQFSGWEIGAAVCGAEAFGDSNLTNEMHFCVFGLFKYAASSYGSFFFFYAKKGTERAYFFLCCLCIDGGARTGRLTNYASNSTASKTTHWVHIFPTAVNVSALSESPTVWAQPAKLKPKAHGSNLFVCMQLSTARVCFYISLSFLSLCKAWANHVRPLSPSGSHRFDGPIYASMIHSLWWGARSEDYHVCPVTVALHHLGRRSFSVSTRAVWVTKGSIPCSTCVFCFGFFFAVVFFSSLVLRCSEAFVAQG